jgi:hypothetical protein
MPLRGRDVGYLGHGQHGADGHPHRTVHASADSVATADTQIQSQAQVLQSHLGVTKVATLASSADYSLDNPNAEWVKQNLGPYGSVIPAIPAMTFGVSVAFAFGLMSICCIM